MAKNYELFQTDIDVSLKNATETLASLKKLQTDLKGLGGFSTDLSKNFKSLQQTLKTFSTRSESLFGKNFSQYIKGVSTDFDKLDATITSLFRNLPRKSEPAVLLLRKQFNTLRSEAQQTGNILDTLDKYDIQIKQLSKAMASPGLSEKGIEGISHQLTEIQVKRQAILDKLKEEGRTVEDVEKSHKRQLGNLQKMAEQVKVVSEAQTHAANAQREQTQALKEAVKEQENLVKLKKEEADSQQRIAAEEKRFEQIAARRASLKTGGALGIVQGARETATGIQGIIQQGPVTGLKDIVDRGQKIVALTTDLRRNFGDITAAVNLFGAQGGNAFVAVRRAIYGDIEPTDTFGKLLDFAVKQTTSFSNAQGDLQKRAAELSGRLVNLNSDLRDMGDSLRRFGKEENVLSTEFAGLNTQLTNSVNKFKNLQSAIERGATGKQFGADIRAYIDGVQDLDRKFENLEGTLKTVYGLDPVSSKTLQHLAEMRGGLGDNLRLLQEVRANLKAQDAGGTFLDKIKRGFSGLVSFIPGVKKGINETAEGAFQLTDNLDESNKAGGVLKTTIDGVSKSASFMADVMKQAIGTAIGIPLSNVVQQLMDFVTLPGRIAINTLLAPFRLMSNIIGTISNQITSFLESLPQQFLQANKQVQDFNTTMKQMLTGIDPEKITKAMRGANEFIRQIIAKTPFELATGQAAFQQLITGGFDPKKWLGPAADAAAAMNKDMGQLIFGMQRLKAGAKGMGVDMLRDFGIPVQQVGIWLDQSTGKMVEANKVLGKSEDELKAAGYAWKKWEFDAAGSLKQTPIEALDILNGYLQQNAIFAGASAARSKTLAGVLSNLNDSVTTILTSFGQPIFQTFTNILTDIYDIVQEITTAVEPFVTLIGGELAKSIQNLWTSITGIAGGVDEMGNKTEGATKRIKEIAASIMEFLKPALMVVLAVVKGDWPKAWGLFLKAAQDAIRKISDWLSSSTGKSWVKWGIDLVKQIAQGIVWGAKTFIKSAVSLIGSTISSFLKPGSPPEQGPLSTIDKWGQGLVDIFASGFKSADMSFLQTITGSIESALGNLGIDKFKSIRKNVMDIIGGINKTGTINQDLWKKVQNQIGKGNKELKEYIGLQLQLKQVSKEYTDAEAAGFIPKELEDKLDAAQTAVQLKEEELKLQEELNQAQKSGGGSGGVGETKADLNKQLKDDLEMLKKKKEIGLITEKEYLDGVTSLRKQAAEQFLQQGDKKAAKDQVELSKKTDKLLFDQDKKFLEKKKSLGLVTEAEYIQQLQDLNKQEAERLLAQGNEGAAKAKITEAEKLQKQLEKVQLSEQKQALEKQVEQERQILEIKYKKGLITEQEYKEGLVRIQEGYIDQLLQLGFPVDKEIDKLKSYKDELKKLTEIPLDKPQDILAGFGDEVTGELQTMMDDITKEFATLGTSTWEEFSKTFKDAFSGVWTDISSAIFGEESGGLGNVRENLLKWAGGLWTDLTAKNGPLSNMTNFFNRISTGFLDWSKKEGKESFNQIGVAVGATLVEGIKVALGLVGGKRGENPVISAFVGSLGSLGSSIATVIHDSFASFTSGLFSPLGKNIADGIGKGLADGLLPLGSKTVQNIISTFTTGLANTNWMFLVSPIFGAFKWLYDVLVGHSIVPDTVNEILDWLDVLKDGVIKPLKDMESKFLDTFAVITNTITLGGFDWLDFFGIDAYSKILEGLGQAGIIGLKKAFYVMGEFVKTQVAKILGRKILESVGLIEKPVKSLVGKIGDFLLPKVVDAAPKVLGFLLEKGPKILQVAGFIGKLVPPLTLLMSVWQNFDRFISDRLEGLTDSLKTELEGVFLVFSGVGDAANSILSSLFGTPETQDKYFEQFATKITAGFASIITSITSSMLEIGGGIAQLLISDTAGMFGTFFQFLGDSLGSYNVKMFGVLLSSLDMGFGQLIDKAKTILFDLHDQIMQIIELTSRDSGALWQAMKDATIMIWNDTTNEIIRLFTDLPNQLLGIDIMGSITNLFPSIEDMTQVGFDMITGLTQGWENAKADMETKVSEVAQTFKSYWPFSPAEKGPLAQPINWMGYLTGDLPPVIQSIQTHFQSITNLATNMAVATKTTFTSMVTDVGRMTGLMVQSVNQAGDRISTGMMQTARATSQSLAEINDAINHSRLSEPLGAGFGNYGHGQQAPNLSGGVAAAWQRFFNSVRSGTSGLPSHQSGNPNVSRTGPALIHKGEMVLPARMAEAVRSVLVNPNTNVKSSQTSKTNIFEAGAFSGAFPNVKSGKDAKNFLDQLESMVMKGELRAQTV